MDVCVFFFLPSLIRGKVEIEADREVISPRENMEVGVERYRIPTALLLGEDVRTYLT